MNEASDDLPITPPPPRTGWSHKRLVWLMILILAAQIGFIFAFGVKKTVPPRAVAQVPHLQLTADGDEMIALGDPTLFALPHANGFGAPVWQRPLNVDIQSFTWTEPPQFLKLDPEKLGVTFRQYMQTNRFVAYAFDFKPEPKFAAPRLRDQLADTNSTLQISGDLAQRPLLASPALPALAYNDVLPPSTVQVLVDAAGFVASLVLLPPDDPLEAKERADIGDTNALRIARNLKFSPSAQPTFGQIVFNWHTVPLPLTGKNTP